MVDAVTESERAAFSAPIPASPLVQLLAPQPGELILDVGCGDGELTALIAESGARVIGLDSNEEMVEAARARGVDAFQADAQTLGMEQQVARFGQFDAVFSSAALHWVSDPDAVASGIFALLKDGGRFVGEMGGAGNLAILRAGLKEEFQARGYPAPVSDSNWFPSCEEFTRLHWVVGFTDVQVERIDQPTDLPDGISGWIRNYRDVMFNGAMVPEWEREEMAGAIEARLSPELRRPGGTYFADYVRLRFSMRKPA